MQPIVDPEEDISCINYTISIPKRSVARELEDLADAVHPHTAETKEETRAAKGGHARSKRKKKRGSNDTPVKQV